MLSPPVHMLIHRHVFSPNSHLTFHVTCFPHVCAFYFLAIVSIGLPQLTRLDVSCARQFFPPHVWLTRVSRAYPRVFYFPATRVSLSDHVWPEPCNCVSSPITRSTPDAKRKKSVVLFCADLFFCNGILHKERRRMRRWWFKEFAFHLYKKTFHYKIDKLIISFSTYYFL